MDNSLRHARSPGNLNLGKGSIFSRRKRPGSSRETLSNGDMSGQNDNTAKQPLIIESGSDNDEPVDSFTWEQISELSSKNCKIEQPVTDGASESTEHTTQEPSVDEIPQAPSGSVSNSAETRRPQNLARQYDAQVGYLGGNPELAAIQWFSQKLTKPEFTLVNDSASLPEEAARLARLVGYVEELRTKVVREFTGLDARGLSAANVYDKVQEANQNIMCAFGVFLLKFSSAKSKDPRENAWVAEWKIGMQHLLSLATDRSIDGGNEQAWMILAEGQDLSMQRFKEVRDATARLNHLLSAREPVNGRQPPA